MKKLFNDEYSVLFNKIFETIDYSCKILKMSNLIVNSHSEESVSISDDLGLLRFLEPNIDKNSPFQNLLFLDDQYLS